MRVLYVTEGEHDEPIQALIRSVAQEKAGLTFPIRQKDAVRFIERPRRGFGRVQEVLKDIAGFRDEKTRRGEKDGDILNYDVLVALIDKRAKNREKCKSYARKLDAVLGVAIEEFEAWILGDLPSIKTWLGVDKEGVESCGITPSYRAEKDKNPKATLKCLVTESAFSCGWDSLVASQYAMEWQPQLDKIEAQCPRGFKPFARQLSSHMRRKANLLPL